MDAQNAQPFHSNVQSETSILNDFAKKEHSPSVTVSPESPSVKSSSSPFADRLRVGSDAASIR